jgi:hypothetical protein
MEGHCLFAGLFFSAALIRARYLNINLSAANDALQKMALIVDYC